MLNTDSLTKLYVEITTTCNLDCQMCVRRAWNEPIGAMPLNTFKQLMEQVSQFPSPPTIHLSGYGEPMSHPNFLEIVAQAKAASARVEMTTNGTLLTAEKANALIDLDLDTLMVSIDGVTPEHYDDIRVNGSFSQVINNLRQLRRIKLRRQVRHGNPEVGIAFVAMKSNVNDIAKLPALAVRIGATKIMVSNVVPHTAAMEQEILYKRSLTACAFRASRWVPDVSLPKFDLYPSTLESLGGIFASRASLSLLDASLSSRNDYCRFAQEGYAAIRWDGEVSPCLSLLHDHPMYLRGRRKDITHYTMGNINTQPLQTVWQSPEFVGFRARLREFYYSPCTTCGGCERFAANFEDCTGNAFPACGGCLWAQGFVQCP